MLILILIIIIYYYYYSALPVGYNSPEFPQKPDSTEVGPCCIPLLTPSAWHSMRT